MDKLEVLTLHEAAAYLKLSERTVYDWAQKGKIPGGKLGASWRFIKKDLDKWLLERLDPDASSAISRPLRAVLEEKDIYFLDTSSKAEVFDFLIEKMSRHKSVKDADELRTAIYEREELMSTGIGLGVGVPHVRIDSVDQLNMVAGVCKNGIDDYESLDSEPVSIVFMISANKSQHSQYIKILSLLSKQLKQEIVRKRLLDAEDPSAFRAILLEEGNV